MTGSTVAETSTFLPDVGGTSGATGTDPVAGTAAGTKAADVPVTGTALLGTPACEVGLGEHDGSPFRVGRSRAWIASRMDGSSSGANVSTAAVFDGGDVPKK